MTPSLPAGPPPPHSFVFEPLSPRSRPAFSMTMTAWSGPSPCPVSPAHTAPHCWRKARSRAGHGHAQGHTNRSKCPCCHLAGRQHVPGLGTLPRGGYCSDPLIPPILGFRPHGPRVTLLVSYRQNCSSQKRIPSTPTDEPTAVSLFSDSPLTRGDPPKPGIYYKTSCTYSSMFSLQSP